MEEKVTRDISSLCPTTEAWKVWLQLESRKDNDISPFNTPFEGSTKEFLDKIKTVELIEDPAYATASETH